MREDGPPTLPSIPLASADGEEPGRTPTWPIDRGHSYPSPTNHLMPLMLGASLVLNAVLLIGLLSVLVFGRSGLFSQGAVGSGSPSPISSGSTADAGLSSPTTAANPTPTSCIQSYWLRRLVAGNAHQRALHQRALRLQWESADPVCGVGEYRTRACAVAGNVFVACESGRVNIGPNQGVLNAGSNMPIQIQNQTHANGPQGVPSQQGTIAFTPATPGAGSSPTVMYTTVGCK